ncbi:MAG: hypothetical protein JWO77_894 [Ilumatobacteraceae bacterium]|nr:hypothetical protein [Ilumatobacteraceae bacterium]
MADLGGGETITVPPALAWLRGDPDGSAWLDELPRLVTGCADRWGLQVGAPYDGSSVSWAAPAVQDGRDVAIKVQWPHPECEHEAAALGAWDGHGAIRLLAHDPTRHALLLERCTPGARLAGRTDVDAVAVVADLLPQLWVPAGAPFRSLAEEAAGWRSTLWARWAEAGEPCERRLVEAADEALRDLPGTQGDPVLLHQDLHGDNILESQRGWLAIDPKPLVGERELGISPAVRDCQLGHSPAAVRGRFDRLCTELGLDRDRALGWTVAQTVAWAWDSRYADQHVDTVRWLLA